MKTNAVSVLLVDDDEGFARSLSEVLRHIGVVPSIAYSTSEAHRLIENHKFDCGIFDYNLGLTLGTELITEVRAAGHAFPVIIITAFGDVHAAVTSLRCGAIDFLEKPVDPSKIMEAISGAIKKSKKGNALNANAAEARRKIGVLTHRERQVVELVVAGKSSREIGELLNLSVRTVEVHRANILGKLHLKNSAQVVNLTVLASLELP